LIALWIRIFLLSLPLPHRHLLPPCCCSLGVLLRFITKSSFFTPRRFLQRPKLRLDGGKGNDRMCQILLRIVLERMPLNPSTLVP
jgi:hypothetical protein